jgi:predicted outer membrane repeat protein
VGSSINFSLPNPSTITLSSALPAFAIDTTLTGPGAGQLTIDGNKSYRVFVVNTGVTVSLSGITVSDGFSTGNGGALYNYGTLNLSYSVFIGNSVQSGSSGGAIYSLGAGAALNIWNSTFSNNSASYGAAIQNESGTLNIALSTFGANVAGTNGGAIYNYNSGTVNIADGTFSGNSAGSNGGSLYLQSGTVNISTSTFSGNSATTHGGTLYTEAGTLTLYDSIVTGSTGDCFLFGGTNNGSNNMLDNGTACPGRLGSQPVSNFDSTLNSNGGPTQTFALLAGSNAIGAIPSGQCTYISTGTSPLFSNSQTSAVDQRGATRKTLCDVGAFETFSFSPSTLPNGAVSYAYNQAI